MKLPLIVFDLDDTLYLERDFARSGYAAVAELVRAHCGIEGFNEICLALLDAGRRSCIFDAALEQLGIEPEIGLVAKLVERYRSHPPHITLAPDATRYLTSRQVGWRGALLTDGLVTTQEAKIKALKLDAALELIICTGRLGPEFSKPDPRCFRIVENWAAARDTKLVYVADNPLKDFITPKLRGWGTVHIQRPQRIHRAKAPDERHEAQISIATLDELDHCIDWFFS